MKALKPSFSVAVLLVLANGCLSSRTQPSGNSPADGSSSASKSRSLSETDAVRRWAENEALVEWQVARLAAGCNDVAFSTTSPVSRREALRLKAAYATSSYAILSGRSPLVQVLDLTGMAALSHQVWVEEGRATAEFGKQAKPVEEAITGILERNRTHALAYMSEAELREV